MLHQKRKGISSLTAIIVASFFSAAIVAGFAMSIYQGTLGNADPARGQLSDMLDDVNDSCAQGISNNGDFEPGISRESDGSEVEVCGENGKSLCYGETTVDADYLSCESIEIECSIQQGTRYTYESDGDGGVIGCG